MSDFDDLLAQAHRLLDQRQDPFDDEVFCGRLVECPRAMEEVVQLRAALLQMEQGGRGSKNRPILLWASGLAAAALLVFLSPLAEDEGLSLPLDSPILHSAPSTPAVMNFQVRTHSLHLNQNPNGNQFRVVVVTSRVSS